MFHTVKKKVVSFTKTKNLPYTVKNNNNWLYVILL